MQSDSTFGDFGIRSAREIAEELLERSRRGLMEDRFDLFADCIALPWQVETFDGQRRLESGEELRQLFDAVRRIYINLGVTDLDRRCVEAEFAAPDTIRSTHETRMLRGNSLIQESFPVYSATKRINGRWKVVSNSYAITDQPAIVQALTGGGDRFPRV